jgi:RNA polymerase sigma factor (sigma-70 family)
MSVQTIMRALDEVAARLPFHLDDRVHLSEVFTRWRQTRSEDDRRVLELWAYCFTVRYFLVKFTRSAYADEAEYDRMVQDCFLAVIGGMDKLHQADRLVVWVNTICRNRLITWQRTWQRTASVDDVPEPADAPAPVGQEHDLLVLRQTIHRAVERLTGILGVVARMRLIDGLSYEEIAAETGRSIPTLQAYMSKILGRLRTDPALRMLREDLDDAPEHFLNSVSARLDPGD